MLQIPNVQKVQICEHVGFFDPQVAFFLASLHLAQIFQTLGNFHKLPLFNNRQMVVFFGCHRPNMSPWARPFVGKGEGYEEWACTDMGWLVAADEDVANNPTPRFVFFLLSFFHELHAQFVFSTPRPSNC